MDAEYAEPHVKKMHYRWSGAKSFPLSLMPGTKNMKNKKILITGGKGMLAADLIAYYQRSGAEIVAPDRENPRNGRQIPWTAPI